MDGIAVVLTADAALLTFSAEWCAVNASSSADTLNGIASAGLWSELLLLQIPPQIDSFGSAGAVGRVGRADI